MPSWSDKTGLGTPRGGGGGGRGCNQKESIVFHTFGTCTILQDFYQVWQTVFFAKPISLLKSLVCGRQTCYTCRKGRHFGIAEILLNQSKKKKEFQVGSCQKKKKVHSLFAPDNAHQRTAILEIFVGEFISVIFAKS